MNKTLLRILILLISAVAIRADDTDDFIRAQMKQQNIPGLSLAVVKNGRIIKAAGYGVADRKLQTPATPDTVYKIASVSKQFIATGIMLLVQDRQLSVDDRVSLYLEGTPESWKDITIRHLLTHTSGLVRESPGFDPFKVQPDAEVIRSAYAVPLRFPPGERYEYGNVGYFALAEIIRKVSGLPWTEYLDVKLFRPSGMKSTIPTNTKEQVANRATGYSDNDKLQDAAEWPALRPSGAFLSTVLDLARWDAMLYTGSILSDASLKQMWEPTPLRSGASSAYGFGWQLGSPIQKLVFHTGGMPGFNSAFARYVNDGLTVIILMNLDDVDMDSIFFGVARIHLAAASPAPESAVRRGRSGPGSSP